MFKKISKSVLTLLIFIGGMGTVCFGEIAGGSESNSSSEYEFPREKGAGRDDCAGEDCITLGDVVDIKENNSIINRLLSVFGLDSDTFAGDHKFINYARAILNLALSLLSVIALIMTIYTFYMMFFSDNEAGIKKAKGNLVGIFIALAIIGLAWIIVSFVFWWYKSNWQENQSNLGTQITYNYDDQLENNQIYFSV